MGARKYNFEAVPARRDSVYLRFGWWGVEGSGKTKGALKLATGLCERLNLGDPGEVVYLVDSENSARLYANSKRTNGFRWKHVALPEQDQSPEAYEAAISYCERKGAQVIIVDSFSHEWAGVNGVLERVDEITASSTSKSSYHTGWREMTPVHNRIVAMLRRPAAHLIVTLRGKSLYQVNPETKKIEKVGLGPITREGFGYEMDVWGQITNSGQGQGDDDIAFYVEKTRCDGVHMGEEVRNPGDRLAQVFADWIADVELGSEPRSLGEALQIAQRDIATGDIALAGPAFSLLERWLRDTNERDREEALIDGVFARALRVMRSEGRSVDESFMRWVRCGAPFAQALVAMRTLDKDGAREALSAYKKRCIADRLPKEEYAVREAFLISERVKVKGGGETTQTEETHG